MDIDSSLLLVQAERLYKIEHLREIAQGGSGDCIYEAKTSRGRYILRVSEYSEMKQSHMEFESRWTEYLSERTDSVAGPVRSIEGRLFEVAEAGGRKYILSLQEKAAGKIVDINNSEEFNEGLFSNLGALMGEIHQLTRCYEGNVFRPEFKWNGPHFWRKNIAILDDDVRLSEKRLLKELDRLPVDKDNYGIVHYDIHTGNFLVDDGKITLIDFDACQFNWYAADIASALFFMVQKEAGPLKRLSEKERTAFAETYLISYLKGYLQNNAVSAYWIDKFDLFMRYQMIDEYVAAQCGGIKESGDLEQWYLAWHKDRIKNGLPYVFIDYKKIWGSIQMASVK